MDFLRVSGLSRADKTGFSIHDLSFTQQQGQKIAIAGETGSGKTTLLKMIAGLSQPDSGEIVFKGERIRGPLEKLVPGHPSIAYLSQHFELRNNYWVHEILEYANELSGERAVELYRLCRIDHLVERRTDQLSGGEKQRVALARLLTGKPELLVLDEPFSNLDPIHASIIRDVIAELEQQWNITIMLVSHAAADVLPWADTILVLKEGRLVQQGPPEVIYRRPSSEYVARLFGEFYVLSVTPDNIRLCIRPGQLRIASNGQAGFDGVVRRLYFFGDYYIAEVESAGKFYKVPTSQHSCAPGDDVFVAYDPKDLWWI